MRASQLINIVLAAFGILDDALGDHFPDQWVVRFAPRDATLAASMTQSRH